MELNSGVGRMITQAWQPAFDNVFMNNRNKLLVPLLRLALLCGFLLWGPRPDCCAQPKESGDPLGLPECIALAQKGSYEAQIARYSFESTKWNFQAFEAGFLPQLSLTADAPGLNRSINIFTERDPFDSNRTITRFLRNNQLGSNIRLNLRQEIPWTGGELSLSSGFSNTFDLDTDQSDWNSSPLLISLSQDLFQYNPNVWDRRLEPKRFEVATREFAEELENLAVDVTNNFFDLYIAQMNLESARFNLQVNDTIFQLSQGRFRVGKIAENELLQSELALRNAEIRVSESQLSYELARRNFNLKLGFPRSRALAIAPPDSLLKLTIEPDFAIRQALNNRSETLGFEVQALEADRALAQAESSNGLSATLTASLGLNQTGMSLSESLQNLEDQENFSIRFSVPVLNWGQNNAQIQAALSDRQRALTALERQKIEFEQRVYEQAMNFSQAQRQIELAAKSDTIAQRRFAVAKNRYLIGKIDITDLFQAQSEKDNSRQAYIQALRGYWSAYYRLRLLTLYDFERGRPLVSNSRQD